MDFSNIVRAFPRRNKVTPTDPLVVIGMPTMFTAELARNREVWISVTFAEDLLLAEKMYRAWSEISPGVRIGGPATGMRGEEHTPGMFTKIGCIFTSRGCPNRCWFCKAWKREGDVREYPVHDGWNVMDDNLLACSESHVRDVFAMLSRQGREVKFTGGLEAARLTEWQADLLAAMRPRPVIYFAYDTPDDWDPLVEAARKLIVARKMPTDGHRILVYVLCGYKGDSLEKAESRMRSVVQLGMTPDSMLWNDDSGKRDTSWVSFHRTWSNPIIRGAQMKKIRTPAVCRAMEE